MPDIEVYPVLKRSPSRFVNWLGPRGVSIARPVAGFLWRLENPQMRWQAEWTGCQHAPRALTRRGVMRKALRAVGSAA